MKKGEEGQRSQRDGQDCPSSTEPANLPAGSQIGTVAEAGVRPSGFSWDRRQKLWPQANRQKLWPKLTAGPKLTRQLVNSRQCRPSRCAPRGTDRIVRPPLNLRTCRQAVRSGRSQKPGSDLLASPGTEDRSSGPKLPTPS